MPRTHDCPCCHGTGLSSDHPRREPHEIVDCDECDASGQVTWSRRQELLAWLDRCRLRVIESQRRQRRA